MAEGYSKADDVLVGYLMFWSLSLLDLFYS